MLLKEQFPSLSVVSGQPTYRRPLTPVKDAKRFHSRIPSQSKKTVIFYTLFTCQGAAHNKTMPMLSLSAASFLQV